MVDVEVVADGCGDEEVGFPVCAALLMKLPESLYISVTTRVIILDVFVVDVVFLF